MGSDSVFILPSIPFRFITLRMAPAAAPSSCPSELTTDITTGRDGCFFWSCELTSTSNTHAFTVADFAEGDLHVLELKQTNLGADARDGGRNVLELDFCDGQSEAQRHLLTSLRTGRQECLLLADADQPKQAGNARTEAVWRSDCVSSDVDHTDSVPVNLEFKSELWKDEVSAVLLDKDFELGTPLLERANRRL